MKHTHFIRFTPLALLPCLLVSVSTGVQQPEELGRYFSKKQFTPAPLPRFEELRHRLPSPIYDDSPLWVQTYWKAWELAFRNFHEPAPEGPLPACKPA